MPPQLPSGYLEFMLLGQATAGWNEIEMLWYLIYSGMLHEAPRDKVDTIFREFQTGAAQRAMIMALADPAFKNHPDLRKKIGQLNARTNDLAGMRNSAVHGVYLVDLEVGNVRVAPGEATSKKRNKLAGKSVQGELTTLIVDIHEHITHLDEFRMRLVREYLPQK